LINFINEANNIKSELTTIRRDIHEHPELGFEEVRTSNLIKKFLDNEGIPYESVASTGVCAVIKGEGIGDNKKTIALRADMDALPIQDKKGLPYSSKVTGKMHACGHDGHTTILLGATRILNNYKKHFSGNIKLLFEPAEETTGGGPIMIKEGVLDNPKVDLIVGLHVTEDLECGKVRVKSGVVHAASNPFRVRIIGSGGHGASPQVTVDPIVIAASIIQSIQTLVSREISPVNPSVITVGSIHGGSAQNVIPEDVVMTGIIRTLTKEDREYLVKRFKDLINNICKGYRAKAEVIIEESYPCLYNDENALGRVRKSVIDVLGEENLVEQQYPSMGVESFAYFANERPAAFYFLGTGNKAKKTDKPAHSSLFDIDEDALPLGVALQCDIAYKYLTSS
jgi:amidohydrolase